MIVLSVLLVLVLVGIICGLTLGLYLTSRLFSIIFFALGSCAAVKYLSSRERPKGGQRRQPKFQQPRVQQPRVPHSSRERQEPKAPASWEDTVFTEKTVDRVGRSERVSHPFQDAPAVPQMPQAVEEDVQPLVPALGQRQQLGRYAVDLPGMVRTPGFDLTLTADNDGVFRAEICGEQVYVGLYRNPLEDAWENLTRYGIRDLFLLYDAQTEQRLAFPPNGQVALRVTQEAVCRRHGDRQLALVQKGSVSVTRR